MNSPGENEQPIVRILLTPIRITLLAVLGLAQFILVTAGFLYLSEALFPFFDRGKPVAAIVGLLSLFYPAYIVIFLKPPEVPKENQFHEPDPPDPNNYTLSYPKSFQRMALAALGLAFLMPLLIPFTEDSPWEILGIAGFIFFLGVLLCLEAYLVQVDVRATGIRTQSPWRRNREISWDEITKVDYSAGGGWYRIHTRDGNIVRLPEALQQKHALIARIRKIEQAGRGKE